MHAPSDVLERDARLLERGHQADEVHVRGGMQPVVVAREEPELREALDVGSRTGNEVGELLDRQT